MKIRKIEIASSSMPATSSSSMMSSSIAVSFFVSPISDCAKASKAPTVAPAWAKTVARPTMVRTTAEISAESRSASKMRRRFSVR